MPSDPDHQMDAWLRAYAEQRREQAGEPLELDPATRRMLQAEVARHYGRNQQPVGPWWTRLGLLWPRVGFALGVVVVLGVVLVSLLQPGAPPEKMAKSMDAPPPPVVSSEPAKEKAVGALGKPAVASAPQEPVVKQESQEESTRGEALQPVAVPALPQDRYQTVFSLAEQARSNLPAVATAIPGQEFLYRAVEATPSSPSSATQVATVALGAAPAPMSAPARPPAAVASAPVSLAPTGAGPDTELAASKASPAPAAMNWSRALSYRFKRAEGTQGVGSELSTGSVPDLLVRFELEQTETGVRIRDADGSVYQGAWLAAQKPVTSLRLRESTTGLDGDKGREVRSSYGMRSLQPTSETRALAAAAAPAPFSFSVSGTNRSAGQKLTFTAVLEFKPDASDLSQRRAESQTDRPGTWFLRGTLQLEGTYAWEIQAAQEVQ